MEQIPVRQQLILVQFRPGFDQTPLFLWKGSGYQLHRIKPKTRQLRLENTRGNELHGAVRQLRKTFG
jgi:hypothetical protein